MPHEWKTKSVSTLSMYTPAHLHQQLAVSLLYLLCIYMFGVYTERFWSTRRSRNQGSEVNGAGRGNKGVVYGGVCTVNGMEWVAMPYRLCLGAAGKACKSGKNLLLAS